MKAIKQNLAEVIAKADKALKTSEGIKRSAAALQKMADTARQSPPSAASGKGK